MFSHGFPALALLLDRAAARCSSPRSGPERPRPSGPTSASSWPSPSCRTTGCCPSSCSSASPRGSAGGRTIRRRSEPVPEHAPVGPEPRRDARPRVGEARAARLRARDRVGARPSRLPAHRRQARRDDVAVALPERAPRRAAAVPAAREPQGHVLLRRAVRPRRPLVPLALPDARAARPPASSGAYRPSSARRRRTTCTTRSRRSGHARSCPTRTSSWCCATRSSARTRTTRSGARTTPSRSRSRPRSRPRTTGSPARRSASSPSPAT